MLTVVIAGIVVGHHTPRPASGAGRLQSSAVWRLVDFLLEGCVFLLIGQQLPDVVQGLAQYATATVIAVTISVGVVLVVRPVWLALTQSLPRSLPAWLGGDRPGHRRRCGRDHAVACGPTAPPATDGP